MYALLVYLVLVAFSDSKILYKGDFSYKNETAKAKSWQLLSAPFCGFNSDGTLNLGVVAKQAEFHAKQGVTHVWAVGGMSQWSTLAISERKALASEWVTHGHKNGLYIIIHVFIESLPEAIELAKHAENIGADAIAVLPPYYPAAPDLDTLVLFLSQIANSVSLPFYYYHFPGSTGVSIKITALLNKAKSAIPTFAGIKYVDSDMTEFYRAVEMDGGKYDMFWANEPKLQSLPFNARGFVLAEGYYGCYLSQVLHAWENGDLAGALHAQMKLREVQDIIGSYGGGKYVMKMFGIDLGPPRLPSLPMSQSKYSELYSKLVDVGFINGTCFQ